MSVMVNMDPKNVFDGKISVKKAIGGLVSLQVGTFTLTPLKAKLAIDQGNATSAVAVLQGLHWGGGVTDSITLMGLCNEAGLTNLKQAEDQADKVTVSFGVQICRPGKEKYYEVLKCTSAKGIIDKNAGKGSLEPFDEVFTGAHGGNEDLYQFTLVVAPDVSTKSQFAYAAGEGANSTKPWGQK